MSDPAKPFFRFHPGVYESAAMKPGLCAACGRDGWIYEGPVYTRQSDLSVCARCIAEDRLGAYLGGAFFSLHGGETEPMRPELRRELIERTPGVASFNEFTWPAIDGVPMAFIGDGERLELWDDPAARAAMIAAWGEFNEEALDGPTAYLLLFRHGDVWRAVVDLD